MISLPGAQKVNNCEIALISIEKNKLIQCPGNCMYVGGVCECDIKKGIKAKQTNSFIATVVSINEKNLGYNGHFSCHVRASRITLIDSEGFSYEGQIMCANLNPLRYVTEYTEIPINSQVNFTVVFPMLPKKVEIARILVKADEYSDEYANFEVSNLSSSDNERNI